MKVLTPKYLTEALAAQAVSIAKNTVFGSGSWQGPGPNFPVKRQAFHVVILVPGREGTPIPGHRQPFILFEQSWKKDPWSAPYDEIARGKAFQHWQGRSNGKTITPHLLFPGDTPFAGSVEREGILAACAGVQTRYDRLMCSITVDSLIALAEEAYKADVGDQQPPNFLD